VTSPSWFDPTTERLGQMGFALVEQRTGGPMGNALRRFSSDLLDLELQSDRGKPVVVWGPRGGTLFNFLPWADLLGMKAEPSAGFDEQLAFFMENIALIRQRVADHRDVEEELRDANWVIVKRRLRLDPAAPRPGRGQISRARPQSSAPEQRDE
jgi:hypothetical protein